jgi:hypothetical protein
MVDILNCQKGCIRGTATDDKIDDIDVELAINEMNKLVVNEAKPSKANKYNPWNSALSLEKRWEYFCRQFSDLNINDFKRTYTNKKVKVLTPSEHEIDAIFRDMLKDTKASRCIDCSCCGYTSCKDMAIAIHNGTNKKENCIHYIKALADEEREQIERIYQDNMTEQEMKNQRLSYIIEKFENLNNGVTELSKVNNVTADNAGHITNVVDEISSQCELISDSLRLFMEFSKFFVFVTQFVR